MLCGAFLLALCGCTDGHADSHAGVFEYNEIYLPGSGTKEAKHLGLDDLNSSWGLWGHNLGSVLPSHPYQTVYAKGPNIASHSQFCFMSDHLFEYISEYVRNNSSATRFAILPNDNGSVCQCAKCKEEGNTGDDASPAVFNMIRRLAARFPDKIFFTSYYQTTRSLPDEPLPENAGVLISTMEYPLCTVATPQEQSFLRLLDDWAEKTDRLYVWDYINNFDDYFTPFPVFGIMQRRLQLYAGAGVKGVFLNGSGPDYSTFSRVKMHILAALLHDPQADWRSQLPALCRKFYPVAGDAVSRFMLEQEDHVAELGKKLPLYEGVARALETYLPEAAFVAFYDELLSLLPEMEEAEQAEMEKLLGALSMTRLELLRIHGDTDGCAGFVDRLTRFSEEINYYNESCWSVSGYLRDYAFMLDRAAAAGDDNLLRGVRLTPLTPLDPDYSDISILTDGLCGLPSNYHCGNLLSSADYSLSIAVPYVKGMRRIRVGLTHNQAYRIALPLRVGLFSGGNCIETIVPRKDPVNTGHSFVEFALPSSLSGTLVLTFVRNPEVHTMSIDEIEAF